jgi:hypothetical protein
MVTTGMIHSSLGVVGRAAAAPTWSKACANCWHAHPFIKSSHVPSFCNQFLPTISALEILVVGSSDKNEHELRKCGACNPASRDFRRTELTN